MRKANEPLISVIVPVYNVQPYLRQCLDSIESQTYRKLEVIVVDDGSKDGSGLICDEYASKHPEWIVIHQENKGLADARNAGLDVYKGDFASFIDSDDYISPFFYEIVVDCINKVGADMVFLSYDSEFWDGGVLSRHQNLRHQHRITV